MQSLQTCTVLLVVSVLIGLSWSLNPRDPNVCSLWESFPTSVKESYAHPYDQVTEEPCSEPRTSYRCTRHRITYKTAYRQAVKMDYRRRYQCCPGYYESRDKCVPRCTKECVHGRCVAPDRCQCEGGWRGDDCSSACNDKHWGPGCGQLCKCENGGLCNPVTGTCQCPPGYIGRRCEDPCPPGTFGKGCLQKCQCGTGGSCNKVTGECLCRENFTGTFCEKACPKSRCPLRCPCQNGGICQGKGICACPPGWTGEVCTERCAEGRFGPNCAHECVCHNRGHCDPETGQCQCAEGFTGNRCSEECQVGSYGRDCKGVCDCANGARCYNIDGGCLCEPGFRGPQCRERMCRHGTYGLHCEHTCLCQDTHTLSCHPLKGECTCQPGWAGLYCNETCARGYYGHGCLEPCLCVNGGVCDSVSGCCHCAPGYMGVHCESPCKSGTYGKNCSLECSCSNSVDCSPIDGTCFCKEGWLGRYCSIPCSKGTWGPGCNTTCQCANGALCNPADGSCTCSPGWQGPLCDQPCPLILCIHKPIFWTTPYLQSSFSSMGTFGPGCLKRCDCLNADGCQGANGQCQCLPGWTGARCAQTCPEGTWGHHCNQSCFCQNSATCLPHSGACVCRPGYWGPTCQHMCSAGVYGDRCSITCPSCAHSSSCHHVTGQCVCTPGYTGALCEQACPVGLYGKQCTGVCRCAHNSSCHHQDGSCRCPPGWTGPDCTLQCHPGMFGLNCAQVCSCPPNFYCDPQTGECVCESGPGIDCKKERFVSMMVPVSPGERDSWGAIAGIVVLVILVVLLLALLLLYRRRQKDKQANTPTVSFSTSRTVNSEYAIPDVPHSYHHYYNPSYHTLTGGRPPLPHVPNNQDRAIKNTNNQLFCNVKNMERERGLFGVESNATLPADWKHHEARKEPGAFGIDRSYSYSASLGKYYNKVTELKDTVVAASSSSLNSENPYATIKDLPGLPFGPPESSYMEMRTTMPHERSYTEISPPPFSTVTLRIERSSLGQVPEQEPQNHYDLPVNSHIPGHYDLPPVRRPPSPTCRRLPQ
uniref:Platelet endothelial aggregation receptor 1 n=1 Tax=Hucho hucho TaxID=62062 RepID=A0A4W5LRA5_9TELE